MDVAIRAGCVGHRAEIAAARACKASAALRGSEVVNGGDLNAAAALAIAPRATRSMEPPPPPPPPRTADATEAADEKESKEEDEEEGTRGNEDDDKCDDDDREEDDEDEETRIAVEDLVFAPEDRAGEPDVSAGKALASTQSTRYRGPRQKRPSSSRSTGDGTSSRCFPKGASCAGSPSTPRFELRRLTNPLVESDAATRRTADAPASNATTSATRRCPAPRGRSRCSSSTRPGPWRSTAWPRRRARRWTPCRIVHQTRCRRFGVRAGRRGGGDPPAESVHRARRGEARGVTLRRGHAAGARVGAPPRASRSTRLGRAGGTAGGGGGRCSRTRVVLLTDGGANVGLDWSESTPTRRAAMEPYEPSKAALREEAVAVAGRLGKAGRRALGG